MDATLRFNQSLTGVAWRLGVRFVVDILRRRAAAAGARARAQLHRWAGHDAGRSSAM